MVQVPQAGGGPSLPAPPRTSWVCAPPPPLPASYLAGVSGLGQKAARSWSMGWVFSPRQLVWGRESRPIGGWVISLASEAGPFTEVWSRIPGGRPRMESQLSGWQLHPRHWSSLGGERRLGHSSRTWGARHGKKAVSASRGVACCEWCGSVCVSACTQCCLPERAVEVQGHHSCACHWP